MSAHWVVKSSDESLDFTISDLQEKYGIPEWVASVLFHRAAQWNDRTRTAIERYLEPSLKYLPDPFTLPDMDRASERLAEAIHQKENIVIYADYDVDGTVGAAVLRRFLRHFDIEPVIYQPDRQKEGYGINAAAVEDLAGRGCSLLIAVDCGITSIKEVAIANSLGLDVIICDHHEPKEVLPEAYAVLDHKRKDNEGAIHSLSGAGVAFYLALATRSLLRDVDFFGQEGAPAEPDLRQLLDLVALATVADLVPLIEENRVLVKVGLEKMRKNPVLGLRELLSVAEIDPKLVEVYHLGFILGPRINAAGRLGSANAALELLTTENPEEARKLAVQLDAVNKERIEILREVTEDALNKASLFLEIHGADAPALILHSEDWHEGVIGIAAARVLEKYHRPVVMITFATHNGKGKGSIRGIPRLDLMVALDSCAEFLLGYGGHKVAAGLSLERVHLENFTTGFLAAVGDQVLALTGNSAKVLLKNVFADTQLSGDEEITERAIQFLEKLQPFGMGNPEPVVILSNWKISGYRVLKERHLKLQLEHLRQGSIEGFWANGVEHYNQKQEDIVDIACLPQINNFRNKKSLELKIKGIRYSANQAPL